MVQVNWAEPALADLEEIYGFIAKDSPRYARLTVEMLTAAAARLSEFPQMGERIAVFSRRDYRQLAVGAYRLVYREDVDTGRVVVVAAIHGARDFPPLLEDR